MPTKPRKARRWVRDHPNFFAFTLVVLVFIYTTAQFQNTTAEQKRETKIRVKAFCSLVYLFDQSIKLQGNKDLGPLQAPYNQWKKDIGALDCPKKVDVKTQIVPSTVPTVPPKR